MSSTRCWACGSNNRGTLGVTGPRDAAPREGDIAVCLYCRAIAVFTGHGAEQRPPTTAELDEFAEDPRIPAAVRIATRVHVSLRGTS